jgi:hypothetical protein
MSLPANRYAHGLVRTKLMIAIATRFESGTAFFRTSSCRKAYNSWCRSIFAGQTSEQEPHRLEARKTAELAGIAQRREQRTDRARDNVPIAGAAGATEHRTGVHAGAAADTGSTAV